MSILLTCAGQRVDLVNQLRFADGGHGGVVAVDAQASTPALRAADRAHRVPPVGDDGYVDALLSICAEDRVDLLISLNDFEIMLLSYHIERFAAVGTRLAVGAPRMVDLCLDKWSSHLFLRSSGFLTPETFLTLREAQAALASGVVEFPMVVKARWGTSSLGIEYAENERELRAAWELVEIRVERSIERDGRPGMARYFRDRVGGSAGSVLVQQQVDGPEYGLDIVNDLRGTHVTTLVREKLVRRASEADLARLLDHPDLIDLGRRLGVALGLPGNLNCDVIATSSGLCVLDLNPRLGTNYPFLWLLGISIPHALSAWARGERPDPAYLTTRPGAVVERRETYALRVDL